MCLCSIYGVIMDFHNDQFLVILVVQLVKCCTGIAQVLVRGPIRGPFLESPENFSGPKSVLSNRNLLVLKHCSL